MREVLRIGSLVLAAVLASAAVAWAQPLELSFWGGWTGPDGDVMRSLVDQYNAEHPNLKWTLTTLQWTPLYSRLVTSARAGQVPDLLATHPQELAFLVELGLLEPIDSWLADAGIQPNEFDKGSWRSGSYRSKQYAVPLDSHMHGLYYNVAMFRAAGLDPSRPPRTGSELVSYATRLTVDNKGLHPDQPGFDPGQVVQWGLGLPTNHHAFYLWFALLRQQGGTLLNADGTRTEIDEARGVAAWRFLEDLVYRHRVVPQGQTSPMNDFITKRVAMVIDGPWQLPAVSRVADLEWATAPFPVVFDRPAAWGSGHLLVLPRQRDATRQREAMRLMKWLTDRSAQWALSGNVPAKLSVLESPEVRALPGRAAFISMLPDTAVLPNIPKAMEVYSAVAPGPILLAAQAAMLRNEDPRAILASLRQRVDAILTAP